LKESKNSNILSLFGLGAGGGNGPNIIYGASGIPPVPPVLFESAGGNGIAPYTPL
jgi:hypothetical protein